MNIRPVMRIAAAFPPPRSRRVGSANRRHGRIEFPIVHLRACGDCQDTHAPGLACASAAALPGTAAGTLPSGLILEARTA